MRTRKKSTTRTTKKRTRKTPRTDAAALAARVAEVDADVTVLSDRLDELERLLCDLLDKKGKLAQIERFLSDLHGASSQVLGFHGERLAAIEGFLAQVQRGPPMPMPPIAGKPGLN